MSIPNQLYIPDDFNDSNEKLSLKNDSLELKFNIRMQYWNNKYSEITNKLLNINSDNMVQVSELTDLEMSVLNVYESARLETNKLIRLLSKANSSRDEFEAEMTVFYLSRKDVLNISGSTRILRILIDGLSREKDRTCKLYESIIDYLGDVKNLLYELKFKISRTHNVLRGEI